MLDFLARRIAISILTFLLITLIVFTGVRMIPGDPARVMAGTDADEAGLQEIRAKYGLTDPILWFPVIRNASFMGKTSHHRYLWSTNILSAMYRGEYNRGPFYPTSLCA